MSSPKTVKLKRDSVDSQISVGSDGGSPRGPRKAPRASSSSTSGLPDSPSSASAKDATVSTSIGKVQLSPIVAGTIKWNQKVQYYGSVPVKLPSGTDVELAKLLGIINTVMKSTKPKSVHMVISTSAVYILDKNADVLDQANINSIGKHMAHPTIPNAMFIIVRNRRLGCGYLHLVTLAKKGEPALVQPILAGVIAPARYRIIGRALMFAGLAAKGSLAAAGNTNAAEGGAKELAATLIQPPAESKVQDPEVFRLVFMGSTLADDVKSKGDNLAKEVLKKFKKTSKSKERQQVFSIINGESLRVFEESTETGIFTFVMHQISFVSIIEEKSEEIFTLFEADERVGGTSVHFFACEIGDGAKIFEALSQMKTAGCAMDEPRGAGTQTLAVYRKIRRLFLWNIYVGSVQPGHIALLDAHSTQSQGSHSEGASVAGPTRDFVRLV